MKYVPLIEQCGATSIPGLLRNDVRVALLDELSYYTLRPAPGTYGDFKTKQVFSSFDTFPDTSLFRIVQTDLERWLEREALPGLFCTPIHFTNLVVQRYDPGPVGISPHLDGRGYVNLIAVFVLEGRGRFCVCDDREGTNPKSIRNDPGDLVLMRGIGFSGEDIRPFHFVDTITEQRTSFALRQRQVNPSMVV